VLIYIVNVVKERDREKNALERGLMSVILKQ
jgi:hypothetical protein